MITSPRIPLALTALMALGAWSPLAAQDCANAQTQAEINACAGADFKAADAELNSAYKQAVDKIRALPGATDKLVAAQRAWIGYRDAACAAEGAMFEGGSIAPTMAAACMTRITTERTGDLNQIALDRDCVGMSSKGTTDMCNGEEFVRSDAVLNRTYEEVSTFVADFPGVAAKLKSAQRAWIPYRDAACTALAARYPAGDVGYAVKDHCLTVLTDERNYALQQMIAER